MACLLISLRVTTLLWLLQYISAFSSTPTVSLRCREIVTVVSKQQNNHKKLRFLTSLNAMKEDNNQSDDDRNELQVNDDESKIDVFYIQEPKLLVGDLISILLTCQLLGLVDILNDPIFWANGGFMQSIDLSPTGVSSLGTLVRRDSVISISWVLSAIKHQGYSIAAVIDDLTAIKCAFTIFIDFCSLLIIFALGSGFIMKGPVDAVDIVRQAYFTIIILGTFRVVYGRFALY